MTLWNMTTEQTSWEQAAAGMVNLPLLDLIDLQQALWGKQDLKQAVAILEEIAEPGDVIYLEVWDVSMMRPLERTFKMHNWVPHFKVTQRPS